ncbi:hypothetical protein F1188_01705 [Roseospira marina]|uniref:Uncharacterized protein n=1 Tax=Roseospira marina TaxID=140057 RepID=A0A5M6IIJ0_9PROT|nr:hypothetical protein [Roseospira marina]KAA5607505.1 hypothetical protein F1188_01705 [Roseospira marina]MBB4312311.1 putative small lipoprotein YifL [Roseospira marina]MBB5085673.1 putative small lipoprotein YifL [Roseospira marina]
MRAAHGIVAASVALALLGGCGRKAPNLPPADSTYPRSYPAPASPEMAPPASTLAPPTRQEERRRVTGPPAPGV